MRIVKAQFANVPFFVAGILLLRGSTVGLYWLAPGFLFSLVAGVVNAGCYWLRFCGSPVW